jgi:flagellar hook-length control protein FliK
MNGLATLLAPVGDMPEVLGMASRPPDSGKTQTDGDGFLGILQQMIAGSLQMAAALSLLPVVSVAGSGTEGTTPDASADSAIGTINFVAESSAQAKQPEVLTVVPAPPPGPSPPEVKEALLPNPEPTTVQSSVTELSASPAQEGRVTKEQQSTVKTATTQPQTKAIELPGVVLVEEDDLVATEIELPRMAVPPKTEGLAVTKGDTSAIKHAPVLTSARRQPGAAGNTKPVQASRSASLDLHADKQAVKQQPVARESKNERNTPVPAQTKSQFGTMMDLRTVLEAGLVDADSGGKSESGEQIKSPQPTKTAEGEVEVAEKQVPTSAEGEEMPAKAVTSPKAAVELQSREDGAAKSLFTHTQQQISTARSVTGRSESVTERFQHTLESLPPETAKSVMDQVVKGAALQVRGDTSEMHIKLIPESLGEVTISVRMEGGQMQAQIDVSHAAVKAALESNMPQLREALNSHGIDVQRLDVCQYGQSMAGDAGGNQSNRSKRQNTRHQSYATEAIEQFDTGRLLGYNTIEVVM